MADSTPINDRPRHWECVGSVVYGINDDATGIAFDDPADARLIALAPGMLEMLKRLAAYVEGELERYRGTHREKLPNLTGTQDAIRAVIAAHDASHAARAVEATPPAESSTEQRVNDVWLDTYLAAWTEDREHLDSVMVYIARDVALDLRDARRQLARQAAAMEAICAAIAKAEGQ